MLYVLHLAFVQMFLTDTPFPDREAARSFNLGGFFLNHRGESFHNRLFNSNAILQREKHTDIGHLVRPNKNCLSSLKPAIFLVDRTFLCKLILKIWLLKPKLIRVEDFLALMPNQHILAQEDGTNRAGSGSRIKARQEAKIPFLMESMKTLKLVGFVCNLTKLSSATRKGGGIKRAGVGLSTILQEVRKKQKFIFL